MEDPDKEITGQTQGDFLRVMLGRIARLVGRLRIHVEIPPETMRFNLEHKQAWWHMLPIEGTNVMQVVCKCEAANITRNFNIRPTAALLRRAKTFGMIRVGSEDGAISCNWTLPIEFEFLVKKPFRKKGQAFTSDLVVYDQFSHAHVIKDVSFEYR